jgi:hypothetical protein
VRTRLGLLSVAIVVALALVSSAALATGGATIASPCLVQIGTASGKPTTWRLVLHGKVSCAQARRTYDAFFRDEDSGACGSGQICGIRQPGGWQCAFLNAVESKGDHGLQADCSRRGASIDAYDAASKTKNASASPEPVLGDTFPDEVGFGHARPKLIETSPVVQGFVAKDVVWESWGGGRATGFGHGLWLPPNARSWSQVQPAKVEVVASDLGICKGQRAYLKLDAFFPEHGGRFNRSPGNDVCF